MVEFGQMKKKIVFIVIGLLLIPAIGVFGYKNFSRKYEIKPKEKVLGEQELGVTPTATPTPLPSNTPVSTSNPTPVSNTNNQQLSGESTNLNVVNTVPTLDNNESVTVIDEYEKWSATQPKDSKGVLCTNPESRCKHECNIGDFWIDELVRILDNHLWEYQMHLEIYGSDSDNTKIWEDAVVSTYNMIYDECKDSPLYSPQNPL